jgi:molecular chaperone DnaK (HSP70)
MVLVRNEALDRGAAPKQPAGQEQQKRTHWSLVLVGIFALCIAIFGLTAGLMYARQPSSHGDYDWSKPYGEVIAIDLGNVSCFWQSALVMPWLTYGLDAKTYSRVAVNQNGSVIILKTDQGLTSWPSEINFRREGLLSQASIDVSLVTTNRFSKGVTMGEATPVPQTSAQRSPGTTTTISDFQALLGRKWSNPKVQAHIANLSYKDKVLQGPNDNILIQPREIKNNYRIWGSRVVPQMQLSPEDLTGMLLWQLKHAAEQYLGKEVQSAVVTVPCNFDDAQRQAVKDAGYKANLEVIRIMNEPTAAAISYELDRLNEESNIVVVDFGGSSLSVDLLNVDSGVFESFATARLPVGGRDITRRVVA